MQRLCLQSSSGVGGAAAAVHMAAPRSGGAALAPLPPQGGSRAAAAAGDSIPARPPPTSPSSSNTHCRSERYFNVCCGERSALTLYSRQQRAATNFEAHDPCAVDQRGSQGHLPAVRWCARLQLRAERKVEALEAALARIEAGEGAALDELMASRCVLQSGVVVSARQTRGSCLVT